MGDKDKCRKIVREHVENAHSIDGKAQAKFSNVSSGVSEAVRIALEPNPVKLTGPGDYFSWARMRN